MSVRANLIAGAEYNRDDNGERVTLTYSVSGVTGPEEARPIIATEASKVPRYNQRHPTKPQLRARQFRAVPRSGQPNIWVVTVVYLDPEASGGDDEREGDARVSMTTEVITEVVTRDINNVAMITKYSRWRVGGGFWQREFYQQTHRVTVEKPTFGLSIERTESAIAFAKATAFAGFTNSTPWQGRPAKTWLLRVRSNQLDSGLHRVTYDAVYNPETWQAILVHTIDGVIPDPLPTEPNGVKRFDVYRAKNFNQLRLPRYI